MLLFSTALCFAEDETEKSVLFILSNPINADIIIDGQPLAVRTPALLDGIDSGEHTVGIRKNGFSPLDHKIVLKSGEVSVYEAELSGGTIIADFPDEDGITLLSKEGSALPNAFRMPGGRYSFSREGGGLEISPLYPKENLLTVNSTLFLTALAVNTVFVIIEMNDTGELFPPHSGKLIISESVTAVLGLTELALLIDRRKFLDDFRFYKADLDTLDSGADVLYRRAQNALERGNIEESLSDFGSLIGNFPDYRRFPDALYKVAKLHIISGDTNLAVSELKIIINTFPDPEIYDKACQTLALLYFNAGDTDESRKTVERMVFHDPLFSETESEIKTLGPDRVIENWARNPERRTD